MAELTIDGGPVFVDVTTDQNYPLLYTRLINTESGDAAPIKDETQDVQEHVDEENQNGTTSEVDLLTKSCINIVKRRIRCEECKRFSAETEEKMLRHVRRVHRGENPFQCYMCEYSTYNKAVFEEHVRIHQGIKPFKCNYCDYRSASKKNAKKHEQIHRPDNPLKCNSCDFIARHPRSLQSHSIKEHPDVKDEEICAKTCKLCKTEFPSQELFIKHRKRCRRCSFKTCSKSEYRAHLEELHFDTKRKIVSTSALFYCALCKWSSSKKPRILLHLIHHPNQKVDESVVDISILRNFGIME